MSGPIRVTELDFDQIKQNLKTFLKAQSEFTDYDFDGSGLSILLDLLAYNTHYQAYYLNMIANEAFLDSALLRDSVVSHAKLLGYTPHSRFAPVAKINFTIQASNNIPATLTIPRGFRFLSEEVGGFSYSFVTLDEYTVTKSDGKYSFVDLPIYEGSLVTYNFTYDSQTNPRQIFKLPDDGVDTKTIKVQVQESQTNTDIIVYTLATDSLDLSTKSEVFFVQESRDKKYEIYFGNDTIGRKLKHGSLVTVNYLITNGEASNKANNFIATQSLSDSLNSSQTEFTIDPVSEAAGGSERETVDNIKFAAPLQFTTQNRLITFKDYESYIQKNYPAVTSVSVWGGEDETPPTFGTVYVALKPKPNYYLSDSEKQRIIDEIIKPKAIVAIKTIIRDPEFLYLLISSNVGYDKNKTSLTPDQLISSIKTAIINYKNTYLDKFSGKLIISRLQDAIDSVDRASILGSTVRIRVQKRFLPDKTASVPYTIKFGVPLRRGTIGNKLESTKFKVLDDSQIERLVEFDEIPQSFSGVSSIKVLNAGTDFTSPPNVIIEGDGQAAAAIAVVVNGKIERIDVTNRGVDYTTATIKIEGGGGYGAEAVAVIDGRIGTIRTVYYDSNAQRVVVNPTAGEIDYDEGTIKISNILIREVNSDDGEIRLSIESEGGILSTIKNNIITIDEEDPTSISVTIEAS